MLWDGVDSDRLVPDRGDVAEGGELLGRGAGESGDVDEKSYFEERFNINITVAGNNYFR